VREIRRFARGSRTGGWGSEANDQPTTAILAVSDDAATR
jgi:hypothetical protein